MALLGAPYAALAHSDLVSTVPEDGATLSEAPTELVFTFTEPLLPDFVRFIALSPDGTTEDLIVTGVDGPVATVSWPGGAGPGTWDVQYRVVSQDGHPVNGGILFSYGAGPAPSPTSAEPTVPPTEEPTAAPSESASTATAPSPSPTSDVTDTATTPTASTSSNSGWIIAGIAVTLLAAVAIVGVILRNRST